jgi:hypothetical protein
MRKWTDMFEKFDGAVLVDVELDVDGRHGRNDLVEEGGRDGAISLKENLMFFKVERHSELSQKRL